MPLKSRNDSGEVRLRQILEEPIKSIGETTETLEVSKIFKGCGEPCSLNILGETGDLYVDLDTNILYGKNVIPSCCHAIEEEQYANSISTPFIFNIAIETPNNYTTKISRFTYLSNQIGWSDGFEWDSSPPARYEEMIYTCQSMNIKVEVIDWIGDIPDSLILYYSGDLDLTEALGLTYVSGPGPAGISVNSTIYPIADESANDIKIGTWSDYVISYNSISGYIRGFIDSIGTEGDSDWYDVWSINLTDQYSVESTSFGGNRVIIKAENGETNLLSSYDFTAGVMVEYPYIDAIYSYTFSGAEYKVISFDPTTNKMYCRLNNDVYTLPPQPTIPNPLHTLTNIMDLTTIQYSTYEYLEIPEPTDILNDLGVQLYLINEGDNYIWEFDWSDLIDQYSIRFCSVDVDYTDFSSPTGPEYSEYLEYFNFYSSSDAITWNNLGNLSSIYSPTGTNDTLVFDNSDLICGGEQKYLKFETAEDIGYLGVTGPALTLSNLKYTYLDSECCWEPLVVGTDAPEWYKRYTIPQELNLVKRQQSTWTYTIPLDLNGLPYKGFYHVDVLTYINDYVSVVDPAVVSTFTPHLLYIQAIKNATTPFIDPWLNIDMSGNFGTSDISEVYFWYNNSVQGSCIIEVTEELCEDRGLTIGVESANPASALHDYGLGYIHIHYLGSTTEGSECTS